MTKEELKEMIDATINENGKGNITGKSLNLALTEIVNSSGEGNGVDTIYMIPADLYAELPQLFEEMIAHNIEIYNKISNKFLQSGTASMLHVDSGLATKILMGAQDLNIAMIESSMSVMYTVVSSDLVMHGPDFQSYYSDGQVGIYINMYNQSLFFLPNGTTTW